MSTEHRELDQQLEQRGYALLPGLVAGEELAALRRMLEREVERRARVLQAAGLVQELHADAPFEQRFGLLMAQCPAMQVVFDLQDMLAPELFRHLRHRRLLEGLQQVLGPDIDAGPVMHVRAKPPRALVASNQSFFAVPWHQDSAVLRPETDAHLQLTCWMPLVDVSEDMGPVEVLPIPRATGHLPHVSEPGYGTTIAGHAVPDVAPERIICQAGDVLVMQQFLPHRSGANTSDRCRWSLDLRFQAHQTPSGRPWYPSLPVWRDGVPAAADYETWVDAWHAALARPNPGMTHRIVEKI
ncbi:MAG: phytanoyl-CoA dioxygenase family protein [Planctomycetota bacterium]